MEILGREPTESERTILRRIPIFDGEIITFMEPIRFLIDIRAAVAVIPGLELSELLLKKTTGFAREYVENMVLKQRLCWNNEYAHKKLDSDMTEDLINGFGTPVLSSQTIPRHQKKMCQDQTKIDGVYQ